MTHEHKKLVEYALQIFAENQAEAEAADDYAPMDPQGTIATVMDELGAKSHPWLVEDIERAVNAAMDEVRARS